MARAKPADRKLRLRLYVVGNAPNSLRAVSNLRSICDAHFAAGHTLEIVDLLAQPLRAVADGIIVTPTLMRLRPLPVQRVVGDLGDVAQVVLALSSK